MENPLLEEGTVDAATMDQVEGSLAAFRQGLEEGFGRIASSAQHLKEVTTQVDAAGRRLEQSLRAHRELQAQTDSALEETRSLLAEAREIRDQVQATCAEARQSNISVVRMVVDLTHLTNDLRERIAALAVLGQPLVQAESLAPEAEPEAASDPALI